MCLWKRNPVYFGSIYISCVGFWILCDDPFQLSPLCFLYWSLLLRWRWPAAYVCSLTFSPHSSRFQLHRCSCLAVCISHGGIAETKKNSEGCSAGWFKSHVCAVAPSTAGRIRPATEPTAWFQSPQACGARLSEREQMVTWIVQQVPSTPAHCLACSTLPQQTPLIIDVLEWAHHHWILQSGRIIKVITAALTYLGYCNGRLTCSEGVNF